MRLKFRGLPILNCSNSPNYSSTILISDKADQHLFFNLLRIEVCTPT
jgi:hypothetical protein